MNDMTLNEACAVTKQFGRFLKGLDRLQEAADAFTSAEQTIRARHAEAEQLGEQNAAARALLESTKAEAASARESAKTDAHGLLVAARAEADRVLGDARDVKKRADAEAAVAAAQTADVVAAGIAAQKELDAARAELARVQRAIEDAKAEALRRFGG